MALNDVPLAAQTLSTSQNPIRQNFSVINTAFTIDHVSFNVANQGQHNKVTFPRSAAAPACPANSAMIYAALGSGGNSALFYKRDGSGAGIAGIDFTTSSNIANLGWCQMPSGNIICWGTGIATGDLVIDTFNIFTNAILNVQLTVVNNNANPTTRAQLIQLRSIDNSNPAHRLINVYGTFFNSGTPAVSFNWLAIGY